MVLVTHPDITDIVNFNLRFPSDSALINTCRSFVLFKTFLGSVLRIH